MFTVALGFGLHFGNNFYLTYERSFVQAVNKIKTRGIKKLAEVGFIDYYCELLLVIRHFYYKSFEVKDPPSHRPCSG